jgi:hypothetical protein
MNTATELKTLLSKFNKGVKAVTIECGIVSVQVSSASAAYGVKLDLLRSRGFSSVTTTTNELAGRGFIVHAVAA